MTKKPKYFLKLSDISPRELKEILTYALQLKKSSQLAKKATSKSKSESKVLKGKVVGLLFEKASTRTRVSFEVGIYELGGKSIYLDQKSIQIGRGESLLDTLLVLERYLDAIIVRNHDHDILVQASKQVRFPIINGLSKNHHPCQALADALTILEYFQISQHSTPNLAYVGEGNNVMVSLIELCSMMKWNLRIATPKQYRGTELFNTDTIVDEEYIHFGEDPVLAVREAHVVYTDTWFSMPDQNTEKKDLPKKQKSMKKLKLLKPYQVNERLLRHADKDYIFMHCLPAYRGQEVSTNVIEGNHSVVFDQAENRLHAQKSLLEFCIK